MSDRKGGMGKRGAAATADRMSGGEAVEAVATSAALEDAVGRALDDLADAVQTWEAGGAEREAGVGRVPIPFLWDRVEAILGRKVGAEELRRALFALEDAGKLSVLAISDLRHFTKSMLGRSLPGVNETFGYVTRKGSARADRLTAARAEWAGVRQTVLKHGDHAGAARRARELVAGLTRAQAVALAGLSPSASKKAGLRQLLDTIDADYFTHAKLIEVDRAARKAGKDFGGM